MGVQGNAIQEAEGNPKVLSVGLPTAGSAPQSGLPNVWASIRRQTPLRNPNVHPRRIEAHTLSLPSSRNLIRFPRRVKIRPFRNGRRRAIRAGSANVFPACQNSSSGREVGYLRMGGGDAFAPGNTPSNELFAIRITWRARSTRAAQRPRPLFRTWTDRQNRSDVLYFRLPLV